MTTKHTPGPWQSYNGGSVIGTAEGSDGAIYIASTRHIPGESAANARLIAAAPDMLEGHEANLTAVEGFEEHQLATIPAWARAALELVARNSRSALAKARGEQ